MKIKSASLHLELITPNWIDAQISFEKSVNKKFSINKLNLSEQSGRTDCEPVNL